MAGAREAILTKLDPVARLTKRINEYETSVEDAAPQVAGEVFADHNYMVNTSEQEIEKRIRTEAERRVERKGVYPPPRFLELPKESNAFDQLISTAQLPVTVPLRPLVQAMDPSERPSGTADLVGMQSVQDLVTGQGPKMDDMGETVRNLLPTVFAASPQLRGKSVFPIMRALRSVIAADAGALVGGGMAPVFREAERLREEESSQNKPISRTEAFSRAATETPGLVNDVVAEALGDAMIETVIGGGAFGARAAKEKLARYLGVSEDRADELIRLSTNHNIDLSVRDVTTAQVARRFSQSVGRMPFVNKIFIDETRRIAGQFGKAYESILSAVAPEIRSFVGRGSESTARRTGKANRDLLNGSSEAFVASRAQYAGRYSAFESAASASGATVAPANTAITIDSALSKLDRVVGKKVKEDTGLFDATGNSVMRDKIVKPAARGDLGRVQKELKLLKDTEDNPSVLDFRGSMQRLQSLVDEVGGPDTVSGGMVVDVLTAMRRDFSDNLQATPDVLLKKKLADDYFKSSVDLFGGRVGDLIRDIDKEFGRVAITAPLTPNSMSLGRRAGTVDPIETVKTLFNSKEPAVIQDLYSILTKNLPTGKGEKLFRESYGVWLASRFRANTSVRSPGQIAVTDTKRLRKDLGLDDPTSASYAASALAMKRSGVSPIQFEQLLALTDEVFEFGIPDISQLITRRFFLGGLNSGARTFAPTSGALTVLFGETQNPLYQLVDRAATSAAVFASLGGAAKRLTDPKYLKSYRVLLDQKAPLSSRGQALRQLLAMDTSFLVFDNLIPDSTGFTAVQSVQAPPPDRGSDPIGVGTSVSAPLPNTP